MNRHRGKSVHYAPRVGRQADGSFKTEAGKHVKDMRSQYQADRLSGKLHGLHENTLKAYRSRIGQMLNWMQSTRGLQSWHHVKKLDDAGRSVHLEKYIEHLQRRPSNKAEADAAGHKTGLNDRSLANHMAALRWFAKRDGIKIAALNEEYGMHRNRKEDEEKPIQFPEGWANTRADYQAKLEAVSEAVGACGQLGSAYGLRSRERSLSNSELKIRVVDTPEGRKTAYSLSVAGRPFIDVTREELTNKNMYKSSFDKILNRIEPGKDYLVVKATKGGRVRLQEIYNQERRDAIDRVQELCRRNEDSRITDGTPPTIFPYGPSDITDKGTVSKDFMAKGRTSLTQTYSKLGGTIRNVLHTNADRHWDTQKLYHALNDGTDIRNNPEMMAYFKQTGDTTIFRSSKQDIIEERGHSDGRKIAHYSADPLNRF